MQKSKHIGYFWIILTMMKIDLKQDFLKQVNTAIKNNEDIIIEVEENEGIGMYQLGVSLIHYYKTHTRLFNNG